MPEAEEKKLTENGIAANIFRRLKHREINGRRKGLAVHMFRSVTQEDELAEESIAVNLVRAGGENITEGGRKL